jgi:lysophospholipase L1-like esterase
MSATETFALEAADPYCLEPAEAAALLRAAPWRRFAVLGDSVAEGVREPLDGYRDASFADRTAEALGATRSPFAYLNLGRRDARLAEVREQQLGRALEFAPDLAMVIAGGNDALSRHFDPEVLRAELVALIEPLREAGARPVTVGLFDLARSGIVPDPYAEPMAERFDLLDEITRAVAAEQGAIHVDTHHHPLAADIGIFSADRIHGNARGHAVAAAAVAEALAAA